MRWYHGGPHIADTHIRSPRERGSTSGYDDAGLADHPDVLDRYESDRVYLCSEFESAAMYASATATPWVYECEPIGELRDDPDFTSDGPDSRSVSCNRALIVRRLRPSNALVGACRELLGTHWR